MTLDMPNKGANILSSDMFAQIDAAISPLLDRDDINGLILVSAKPKIFVAGADLVAINNTLDWPDENIVKFCDDGRAVMRKFSETPFPTVAAIHGACVGGGLELALWCDYRIASSDRRSILGLPESKLGLVPGWAGTVRIARIIESRNQLRAIETQIDMVASGNVYSSSVAAEQGWIDQVVEQAKLIDASAKWLQDQAANFKDIRNQVASPLSQEFETEAVLQQSTEQIQNNPQIFSFAPFVALEHILRSSSLPMKEACDSESLAMAKVYGSPASYGLINNFFLGEHNKKKPGFFDRTLEPNTVQSVAIVGAGVMGSSIARANLKRKKAVALFDSNSGSAERVAQEIASDSLTLAEGLASFSTAELIIESATENLDTKKEILQRLEEHVGEDAIIATNTSSIPLRLMASDLKNPERFCGIHFCHPEKMSLVEIVRGDKTSEQTVSDAVAYVKSLGKMPVVVKDQAGFVVNRLLSAFLKGAFRLFAEGHSIEQVDAVARDFGFQAGPFEIVDIIGADTCLYAGQMMWDAKLRCVSDSLLLPRLVKLGRLGQKTGVGFYNYESESQKVDPKTLSELSVYQNAEPTLLDHEDIMLNLLAGVVLEASRIVDEELVADYRDIELCIIHGFSFPAEHGGILFWAERMGIAQIVDRLDELKTSDPNLEPSESLRQLAAKGNGYYCSS